MSQPSRGAKQVNRAPLIEENFNAAVAGFAEEQGSDPALLERCGLHARDLAELFESQLMSRHLDLMARQLRLEDKVFYTIGSSGHEGNAMVARCLRSTDPAFLHYRSGGFMMERSRQIDGIDPVFDTALSFAASALDPASGGRHKVWGSKALWVPPQTSTIASQLPKAVGAALAIHGGSSDLPIPADSVTLTSFGDASLNHSTAQGAINAAQWASYQGLPVPVIFLCEDNGIGISVSSPPGWVGATMSQRPGLDYRFADGLDLAAGWSAVSEAVAHVRRTRRPLFLHMKTVRIMGHAGTDFEVDYRKVEDVEADESRDPLIRTAQALIRSGINSANEVLALSDAMKQRCFEAAERAAQSPKLTSLAEVAAPLAPLDPESVMTEATRVDETARLEFWGADRRLPENGAPKHLAVNINRALNDLLLKYPESRIFGEDVAQKGGVYTVTKGLRQRFGARRVFNTMLDEQTILGLAQGYGLLGMLPLPEIQYLAYFHNACDQIRGEAASLQFFSNGQFANPMVMRIASLGYQKGFGGHFHNDNSIAALRDIPGLVIGIPSRGDDAVRMLRTMTALAKKCGRVCAFLEPIALYMTRDLYVEGDGEWLFEYPDASDALPLDEPRVYHPEAADLLVITFGNGVPMSLRAAAIIDAKCGATVRVVDLRWVAPLPEERLIEEAAEFQKVLIVDEGRRSGGLSEALISLLAERLPGTARLSRVVGADCYTPLGSAAKTVLPDENQIVEAALSMLQGGDEESSVRNHCF